MWRPMSGKLKRFFQGFLWALSVIFNCILTERNFRIHLAAAFYAVSLSVLLGLSQEQRLLVWFCIGLVLAMELLNTAVEALADLVTQRPHPLAKRAKDVSAGAVLVAAFFSAGIGVKLFWRPDALLGLLKRPAIAAVGGLSFLFFLWFIFFAFPGKRQGE